MVMMRGGLCLVCFLACLLLSCGEEIEINPDRVAVVMSHGRSGSTELTYIVSHIAKGKIAESEIFGANKMGMSQKSDPLGLMLSFLIDMRRHYPDKYIGFKWKPFYNEGNYTQIWEWFEKNGAKVVYNHRNPLDILISLAKIDHDDSKLHCRAIDQECIELQRSIKIRMDVSDIIAKIETLAAENVEVLATLKKFKVNHIVVTYEELNHGTIAQRLTHAQRIADFLFSQNAQTTSNIVVDESIFDTRIAYIGHFHQSESVLNYDELMKKLRGTKYEHLLH